MSAPELPKQTKAAASRTSEWSKQYYQTWASQTKQSAGSTSQGSSYHADERLNELSGDEGKMGGQSKQPFGWR